MTSFAFLFADQNGPFLVAMVVTLSIAALEVVSLVLGFGLSSFIDDLLPDIAPDGGVDVDVDVDTGVDIDADVEADLDSDVQAPAESETNVFGQALGWLNVGRVPFLVLLIAFLGTFAVIGLVGQLIAGTLVGLVPAAIAGPAAAFVALPATRVASRVLGRIVPREETYAVSDEQFVGLVATITLGPVDRDTPGKARVTDRHGNVHFVRVRSARAGRRFETGSEVLLVRRQDAVFEAITPPGSLRPDNHKDGGDLQWNM